MFNDRKGVPGPAKAARAKQEDRQLFSPLRSQPEKICVKATPKGGFNI